MQLCLYSGSLAVVKARALPCVFLYYGVGVGRTLHRDQNGNRILVLMGVNGFLSMRTFSYWSSQCAGLSK